MASSSSFPFPRLSAENYSRWCVQMRTYLGGQDVWEAVEEGVDGLLATATTVKLQREAKIRDQRALSFIQQGVDDSNFETIASAKTAKEAWDLLQTAFKGIEKVQRVRLQTLRGEWESLRMKEAESIADFYSRVKAIVNLFSHNGETLDEIRIVEKILRSLTRQYDPVVIAIEEGNDVSTMKMAELMGSLIAHEEKFSGRSKESLEHALQAKSHIKEDSNHRSNGRVIVVVGILVEEGDVALEGAMAEETVAPVLDLMVITTLPILLDKRLINAKFSVIIVGNLVIMLMNAIVVEILLMVKRI
ncbi:hypothetical protein Dimus_039062 [Dionaea muscipula]